MGIELLCIAGIAGLLRYARNSKVRERKEIELYRLKEAERAERERLALVPAPVPPPKLTRTDRRINRLDEDVEGLVKLAVRHQHYAVKYGDLLDTLKLPNGLPVRKEIEKRLNYASVKIATGDFNDLDS
jgi:hypothetical protein